MQKWLESPLGLASTRLNPGTASTVRSFIPIRPIHGPTVLYLLSMAGDLLISPPIIIFGRRVTKLGQVQSPFDPGTSRVHGDISLDPIVNGI